jgi:hypothetical protein
MSTYIGSDMTRDINQLLTIISAATRQVGRNTDARAMTLLNSRMSVITSYITIFIPAPAQIKTKSLFACFIRLLW